MPQVVEAAHSTGLPRAPWPAATHGFCRRTHFGAGAIAGNDLGCPAGAVKDNKRPVLAESLNRSRDAATLRSSRRCALRGSLGSSSIDTPRERRSFIGLPP